MDLNLAIFIITSFHFHDIGSIPDYSILVLDAEDFPQQSHLQKNTPDLFI